MSVSNRLKINKDFIDIMAVNIKNLTVNITKIYI